MNHPRPAPELTSFSENNSEGAHLQSDPAHRKPFIGCQSRVLQKTIDSVIPDKPPVDISARCNKVIIVIDKDPNDLNLIDQCLYDTKDTPFTFISSTDRETVKRLISSYNPDLIVADWKTILSIMSTPEDSHMPAFHDIPMLLLTDDKAVDDDAFAAAFGEGMIEFVQKPIDKAVMKAKVQVLLKLKDFVRRIKAESQVASEELDRMHRELHFDLILHSRNVKERFLEEINQLNTHVSIEGRSKLRTLVRKFRWAIDDEAHVSFERTFDDSNRPLYKQLEHICPNITRNEKRLCAFLIRDKSGSEIAKTIGKNPNSINVAFARLRSKLRIATNKDLKEFLTGLNTTVIQPA